MEAYIYTYVNKETQKTYIGSRCSYKGQAEDDFNINYFSSSKNEEFLNDMKNGKLEGQIILKINCKNANKKIVKIEHNLISAYWEKYGKENSYNRYCNGKFCVNGLHVHPGQNYRTGCKLSEETKRKISVAHKGTNFRKPGYHHSQETIEKIRQGNIGHEITPETRKKISESLKGRKPWNKGITGIIHQTEEAKRKIGEYNKGKKWPAEFGKKVSDAKKGKSPLKFKWITPDGEIKIMDKSKVALWHKDWILYDKTPVSNQSTC